MLNLINGEGEIYIIYHSFGELLWSNVRRVDWMKTGSTCTTFDILVIIIHY